MISEPRFSHLQHLLKGIGTFHENE
uniref:Uncharacterized protein n=1 Tax=Lepeophtheirus salmonis TaxID=72036 RepID=A0A0K2VG77_LEPSM